MKKLVNFYTIKLKKKNNSIIKLLNNIKIKDEKKNSFLL